MATVSVVRDLDMRYSNNHAVFWAMVATEQEFRVVMTKRLNYVTG